MAKFEPSITLSAVRVCLSKTIQEQQYEPLKIEVETVSYVDPKDVDNELKKQTEKLEDFVDNFILSRDDSNAL